MFFFEMFFFIFPDSLRRFIYRNKYHIRYDVDRLG